MFQSKVIPLIVQIETSNKDIYWVSLYLNIIVLKDVVYGKVQDDTVYYQVAYRTGTLRCYYKRKGSSLWTKFVEEGTYHKGYAQCPAWAKGNPKYDIMLEIVIGKMIGLHEETDEETAISNGPYPVKGKLHKCKVPKNSIFSVKSICVTQSLFIFLQLIHDHQQIVDVALQAHLEIALLTPRKGHQKATNAAARVMVLVVEGQQ